MSPWGRVAKLLHAQKVFLVKSHVHQDHSSILRRANRDSQKKGTNKKEAFDAYLWNLEN